MKKIHGQLLKRILVMVLCGTMLLGEAGAFLPPEVFMAAQADENGFIIDDDGVLTGYQGEATEVAIPETVKKIGDSAFANNTTIVSVVIPEGVTSIGSSAFSQCTSLVTVEIPEGVTSIGDSAFFNCKKLTGVTLPSTLETLSAHAFGNCQALERITIPAKVSEISMAAFYDCRQRVIHRKFCIQKLYKFGECRDSIRSDIYRRRGIL